LNEQVENERSNKPMAKKQHVGRPKKLTTTLQPNGNIKKEANGVPKGLMTSKWENTPIYFNKICSHEWCKQSKNTLVINLKF